MCNGGKKMETKTKTFYELMEELGCDKYYVVEIDGTDDGAEYTIAPDEVSDSLGNCNVMDYTHVSKSFAVVYVDVTDEDEDEVEDDDDAFLAENVAKVIEEYIRNSNGDVKLVVGIFPSEGFFTIAKVN
jgi:hypothetical protein